MDKIREYQANKLNKHYKYAKKNIKYYSQRNQDYPIIKFNKNSLLNDIKKLPILDKEEVKNYNKDFFEKTLFQKSHFTSGSSGTPMELSATIIEKGFQQALFNKINNEIKANVPIRLFLTAALQREDGLYQKDILNKNLYLSIFKLTQENKKRIVDLFKTEKINSIYAYPSALYQLSLLLNEDYRFNEPISAVVTSEVLKEDHKKYIETTLNVKVYNFYSSQEGSHAALECKNGNLHINPFFGIIEILDEKGEEVEEGEIGNLVVTGLIRKSFPLFRYKIGDLAKKVDSNAKCDCENSWPLLGEVMGRDDDLIKTRAGETFRLSLYKGVKSVIEGQLIQHNYTEFELNVIPKEGKSYQAIEKELSEKLSSLLGEKPENLSLKINYLKYIPRGPGGKFRSVYSKI